MLPFFFTHSEVQPCKGYVGRLLHPRILQTLKHIFLSVLLIFGSITVFSVSATYLAIKPLDFTAPAALPIQAEVIITTELLSVDATARTLEMDWYPGAATGCNPDPGIVADIYFELDFLDSSSPSFTSIPPAAPAYQLNTSQICGGASTMFTPVFRTVTKLLGTDANPQLSTPRSSLQEYPFDVYSGRIAMYAVDHTTGAFISLNVTRSYGIAVNFEVTTQRAVIAFPELQIYFRITRSKAAKIFVVLVIVSNWLVTAAFLVISAAALVYPNPRYYSEMFVLPVGVLFAFTSIRANLPGAPVGFGARIDLYSILPVLVIVTLCSFFLLLVVLYQRIYEGELKVNVAGAADLESQSRAPVTEDEYLAIACPQCQRPHSTCIERESINGGSTVNASTEQGNGSASPKDTPGSSREK